MAQLNSRGTLTRGRWDFFEHSNGWASVLGSVVSGFINAYFANNSTATLAIDIYNLTWFASVAQPWRIFILVPPLVLTPITPDEVEVHACQLDAATPPGICGMFSANTSAYFTVQRISNAITNGIIEPVAGEPFITLPPGWAIGVGGDAGSNPCELSLSVWFQPVLDNIPPAR
jgi:hypothetical protein